MAESSAGAAARTERSRGGEQGRSAGGAHVLGELRRAFGAALAALVVLAALPFAVHVAHQRIERSRQHGRTVSHLALEARALVAGGQADLRDSSLTGDSLLGSGAQRARAPLADAVDSLLVLTADDPAQHRRARAFRESFLRWERELVLGRRAAATAAGDAGRELAGQARVGEVRAALAALLAGEDASDASLRRRDGVLARASVVAPLALVLALAWVLLWLRRHVVRQTAELLDQQVALEDLAAALQEQAAELEEQAAELQEQAAKLEATNQELNAAVTETEAARAAAEQAAAELRKTNELLRALLDSSPLAILATELGASEGRVLQWNAAAEQLFGWRAPEVLGRPDPTVSDEHREESRALRDAALAGRSATGLETQRLRKDGTLVDVSLALAVIRDAHGAPTGFVLLAADRTEHRRLEAQLRQAQKMEAVGRLAGGVAHDFNNMLTAIKSYSQLVLADLAMADALAAEALAADVREIDRAADRAAQLTKQLLAFSRQQVLEPRVLDLNETVGGVEAMLRRLIGADVEVRTRLAPTLGRVQADPGQLEQVLMNLAVNARDAMPGGGTLTIETANVELDGRYARGHAGVEPGPYVMLAVSDTGVGMDPATQARIFEPFFTTKAAGKGTGLGLSTVYGIVEQSDGHVEVYSTPGLGTTFKVYLPRLDAALEDVHREERDAVPRDGSETILLVEDDETVRAVARRVLQRAGYTVLEAANGAQALRLCEHADQAIDLVVTDMVMPELGGRELATRLRARRPEMRFLFMSGYTEDAALRANLLEASAAFLGKPYTPTALAGKVREVLETA
jgi:PAS domain S-box-containing protein